MTGEMCIILKHNRGYYRENECGYTASAYTAGIYSRETAEAIAATDPRNYTLYPVPKDGPAVESLAEAMFLADVAEPDARKRKIGPYKVPAYLARWGEGCGTQIGIAACDSYRRRARFVLSAMQRAGVSIDGAFPARKEPAA